MNVVAENRYGFTMGSRIQCEMHRNFSSVRHFFVDEAGDSTLFDRRGRLLVGSEGVSHTFMVGICEVSDPPGVAERFDRLRRELLRDPYFRGVPSMSVMARKTASSFHAKDDIPEIRREVYRLISTLDVGIIVAFRRKLDYATFAVEHLRLTGRRITSHEIYDGLVERACASILHDAHEARFTFARRGKAARNAALLAAIKRASSPYKRQSDIAGDRKVIVSVGVPSESAGLQVADYLLWALQRLIERREDRYFNHASKKFQLILDLDDRRRHLHGEWYNDSNPLTVEKLKPVVPG